MEYRKRKDCQEKQRTSTARRDHSLTYGLTYDLLCYPLFSPSVSVSRSAVCLLLSSSSSSPASVRVRIRVLGRNPIHIQPQATNPNPLNNPEPVLATPYALPPTSETDWPLNATLYLLHAPSNKLQYPFTLCARTEPDTIQPISLSLFDPEATQDVASVMHERHTPSLTNAMTTPMQINIQRASYSQRQEEKYDTPHKAESNFHPMDEPIPPVLNQPIPMSDSLRLDLTDPTALIPTGSQLPLTESEVDHPPVKFDGRSPSKKRHFDETKATIRPTAEAEEAHIQETNIATPQAEQPNGQFVLDQVDPHLPDEAFRIDDDVHEFHYESGPCIDASSGGAGVSAVDPDSDPSSKRLRTGVASTPYMVPVKRCLDSLSVGSASTVTQPNRILEGFAVYLLSDGIGTRQIEIMHANIIRRGGILLHELPKHRYHVTHQSTHTTTDKKRSKKADSIKKEIKYPVLLIVSSTIRTRKALEDVLSARMRHAALADSARRVHRLGVPNSAIGGRQTPPPPASPKSPNAANSPTLSVASGSSAASSSGVRVRGAWQIHHIEWLVESFKRGQLLGHDQFILDDADPNTTHAASRRLDYPIVSPAAGVSTAVASSGDSHVAAASSTHAAAAAAAPHHHQHDDDEHEHAHENDDEEEEEEGLSTAAGIAAWNNAIAAQLRETAEKYNAQAGEVRRIQSSAGIGIVLLGIVC